MVYHKITDTTHGRYNIRERCSCVFPNLRAEMARYGVSCKHTASMLGVSPKSISNKITGRTEFTLSEMISIRNAYFKEMSIEYLFDSGVSTQGE